MAQYMLFGKDLSLALPHCGVQYSDPGADLGSPITGNIVAADDNYAWQHCTQALGKKIHAAELVDYLGDLPVLETGVRTPIPLPRSYKSYIPESISTQLTMFYAGTVNVFDNVIADKAQIVFSFAEKTTSMQAATPSFKMPMTSSIQPSAPHGTHLQDWMKKMQPEMKEKRTTAARLSVGERLPVTKDEHASLLVPCEAIVPTALPIARKVSLARFLEKRKERVQPVAPYMAKGTAPIIIHQGGSHQSNASTLERYYHEFFGGPDAKKLRCASALAYVNIVDVEDHNWFTDIENSKRASESESAT